MTPTAAPDTVRLALPKGRMKDSLFDLMGAAGVKVTESSRGYRPRLALEGFDAKILKPQSVIQMLQAGSRDVGFAGADWVAELDATGLVEVMDLGLDPVRLVAAAPSDLLDAGGNLPTDRPLLVASEMERLTTRWIESRGLNAVFVRTYGATEVFPPEDADCIVDITQTGSTLEANRLTIIDTLLTSSTRLYANEGAMANPVKRERIEHLALLLRSVLEARERVMLALNVASESLERVLAALPCMREPTVSPLSHDAGYAVSSAVPRADLARVIPILKQAGATDLVVTQPSLIVR
ncbi:MAG: ATP phosphoribosyltransferase [Phycisphaerales bacterium]|nr:MAG: ATP phosphoribosyltransferase [Phycisphaerales bacterium]